MKAIVVSEFGGPEQLRLEQVADRLLEAKHPGGKIILTVAG